MRVLRVSRERINGRRGLAEQSLLLDLSGVFLRYSHSQNDYAGESASIGAVARAVDSSRGDLRGDFVDSVEAEEPNGGRDVCEFPGGHDVFVLAELEGTLSNQ